MLRILERWQPSESIILGGMALLVGLASGAGVWVFKKLIDLFDSLFYTVILSAVKPLGSWLVIFLPVLGGLIVGLILHFFIGEERHHGVAGIMEAVALAGGRLRYRRVPAKALASAISIGAGASVGPEDPSVQIGANIGSLVGQKLHLSDERMRSLVAAGSASGIAAAFNAPIAGVFFALEIILGEISGSAFGVVVLAAVISAVFTQAVSGAQPAFAVPSYAFGSAWELPFYFVLGLVAGPISALYVRMLYAAQDFFHHRVSLPRWAMPMLAGLGVGIVGFFVPQVLGVGYDSIEQILSGQMTSFWLMAALVLGKIILTPTSIAGGFPGGVFAPSLFIGAALGGAFGVVVDSMLPGMNISPPAFALVGMAAVLAGAVHSPVTAFILLFEMTRDYRIILPLMFSVVVSLLISQQLQKESVYTLSLARKGIRLERGRDVEVLETLTVEEVMKVNPDTLRDDTTVQEAMDFFFRSHHHGVPVLNASGELEGIVTLQDLEQARMTGADGKAIGDICTRQMLVAYPDETIGNALRLMGTRDVGRLPVVSRDNPTQLLGLLRRTDLVRAYDVALTKRAAMRHRAHQVRLGVFSGGEVRVEEFFVEPDSPCANKHVKEINWPRDAIIASIRRGRQIILPHGDSLIRSGDVLVVVVEGDAGEQVRHLSSVQKAT